MYPIEEFLFKGFTPINSYFFGKKQRKKHCSNLRARAETRVNVFKLASSSKTGLKESKTAVNAIPAHWVLGLKLRCTHV